MDEPEAFAKAAKLLLKEPDRYGLLMLERSARQGGHAVFEREKGKTVLENQVRIATMLKCEMDTSAHDINRVYFTTTSDDEEARRRFAFCSLLPRSCLYSSSEVMERATLCPFSTLIK